MTTLRRYIFAFFAVCAAFAAGIALGNGPLQGDQPAASSSRLAAGNPDSAAVRGLHEQQAFSDAVAKAAAHRLLLGQLQNMTVGIVVGSGVPRTEVSGVAAAVEKAGGEVSLVVHLTSTVTDPARKTYIDSVAANSLKGMPDLKAARDMSPYERLGALLSRAYTGSSDGLAVDDEARRIDAQLQGARLVRLDAPLQRRANAIIVLATGEHGAADDVYAAHQIQIQLLNALAASVDGVVVAAPSSAALVGGLIAEVRSSRVLTSAVSTLDVIDSPAGQVAAVAALAAGIGGRPGAYGVVGDRVVLPPGLQRRGY